MTTFPGNKIFDSSLSIWDRNVQDKITHDLDKYVKEPDSVLLYSVFEDIISLHQKRSKIQDGLNRRAKLIPASTFENNDPREANGVPIFSRPSIGESKENHKLHTAFDKKITVNKAAYIAGQAPAVNGSDGILDYYTDSEFDNKLMELLQSATRGGNGYLLAVSPEGENEAYLTLVDEWQCVSFYDTNSGKLKYSVRYYSELDLDNVTEYKWYFDLYTEDKKYEYIYTGAWQYKGEIAHLFSGVPLVEFANNTERLGDVELTISLQDAFDVLQSDLSSEVTQMRLAYLSMPDSEVDIDETWLETLKKTGIFIGDGKFIEKNLNSETVENLKNDLKSQIYEYSNSYDPNALGDDKEQTAYQIKQKLFGLEMSASETIKMFEKSARYLFELVSGYLNTFRSGAAADFTISFRRNIPSNNLEDLNLAMTAGARLSQKKMLSLMPFEVDYDENLKELEEESVSGAVEEPITDVNI